MKALRKGLLVLFAILALTMFPQCAGDNTYRRSYTWAANDVLRCDGGESACDKQLSSPDYVIDTPYQNLEVTSLDVECKVQNNGPQNAMFDVGVLFGPEPTDIGSPPYPYGAQGVYHGAAFGWLEPGAYSPSWSIDFKSGKVAASGALVEPTKSLSELSPHGNLHSGLGTMYLKVVVWSRASGSSFDLRVESCTLDIVMEASVMLATTTTVTSTLTETVTAKLFGSVSATEALLLVVLAALVPMAYALSRRTRKPVNDETKIY